MHLTLNSIFSPIFHENTTYASKGSKGIVGIEQFLFFLFSFLIFLGVRLIFTISDFCKNNLLNMVIKMECVSLSKCLILFERVLVMTQLKIYANDLTFVNLHCDLLYWERVWTLDSWNSFLCVDAKPFGSFQT